MNVMGFAVYEPDKTAAYYLYEDFETLLSEMIVGDFRKSLENRRLRNKVY